MRLSGRAAGGAEMRGGWGGARCYRGSPSSFHIRERVLRRRRVTRTNNYTAGWRGLAWVGAAGEGVGEWRVSLMGGDAGGRCG